MGSFGPLFLVRFPYTYLGENESFIVLDNKSIVKAEKWVVLDPYF